MRKIILLFFAVLLSGFIAPSCSDATKKEIGSTMRTQVISQHAEEAVATVSDNITKREIESKKLELIQTVEVAEIEAEVNKINAISSEDVALKTFTIVRSIQDESLREEALVVALRAKERVEIAKNKKEQAVKVEIEKTKQAEYTSRKYKNWSESAAATLLLIILLFFLIKRFFGSKKRI